MRTHIRLRMVVLSLAIAAPFSCWVGAEEPDFDRQVAPILASRCLECHGGMDPKGKLDLSRAKTALLGGESGPAIVRERPDESYLWQRVQAGEMPPKHPLPADERAILKAWISAGAKWGTDPIDPFRFTTKNRAGYDWWSLQPLTKPQPPKVKDAAWPKNAIDQFVLAELEAQNLQPSPASEPRMLVRRLYFDVIGLPPSPQELEEVAPHDAIVDRLLASPHYGERWARHWLDVAHYGESDGFEFDRMRPHAWRYRDWVIGAFNCDLPYDQFARLQIAGDVLEPGDEGSLIATGFLVGGAHDSLMPKGQAMQMIMRQDELEDLVALVSQSFLGLTVNCARCHDHKFDPVKQTDYYRLAAALAGVKRGNLDLPSNPLAKQPQDRKAFAVTPQTAPVVNLLVRGNVQQPGEVVTAAGIGCLNASQADFQLAPDAPDALRRIKLAAWIASEHNPLFARTIVNRAWQYHFGRGLVETPNDLGFSGGQPSHPELLDWLASDLISSDWSLKRLHRLILTSATYQQASHPRADCLAIDADNRLLWRYAPRRLDAECVRDAMLTAAMQLNCQMGGPSYMDFRPFMYKNAQYYEPIDPVGPEYNRRTIYRFWARGGRNPLLDTFDCPDPSTAAPLRASTTTPLQALSLFNNSFTLRMAEELAKRLERESPNEVVNQVDLAFTIVYGRPATAAEHQKSQDFVSEYGLPFFCRVILNSNGFLYVD